VIVVVLLVTTWTEIRWDQRYDEISVGLDKIRTANNQLGVQVDLFGRDRYATGYMDALEGKPLRIRAIS
jgi:hypothetical protein